MAMPNSGELFLLNVCVDSIAFRRFRTACANKLENLTISARG